MHSWPPPQPPPPALREDSSAHALPAPAPHLLNLPVAGGAAGDPQAMRAPLLAALAKLDRSAAHLVESAEQAVREQGGAAAHSLADTWSMMPFAAGR